MYQRLWKRAVSLGNVFCYNQIFKFKVAVTLHHYIFYTCFSHSVSTKLTKVRHCITANGGITARESQIHQEIVLFKAACVFDISWLSIANLSKGNALLGSLRIIWRVFKFRIGCKMCKYILFRIENNHWVYYFDCEGGYNL